VAGGLCLVQALVLVGLAVFYLVELFAGAGSDQARVLVSAVLILVVAAALALLARLWWSGSTWATTPTVLWNLLLVPVALSVVQAGQLLLGILLVVVLVPTILAALAGRVPTNRDPRLTWLRPTPVCRATSRRGRAGTRGAG